MIEVMELFTPEAVVMLLFLAIASYTDATTGKIYNNLTFPMMLVGAGLHFFNGTPMIALWGILGAVALHYPMWMLGVEKGGDVKLLMGIGALVGFMEMAETTAYYAILYLPIGVGVLALRGRLQNLVGVGGWMAKKASGQEVGDAPEATVLWTAPVISAAAVVAWLTDWIPLFT
jgi:Flp pilus assembly protein protease CpaA